MQTTYAHRAACSIADWLRSSWKRGWLIGVLLVAATIIAYQPAWHGRPVWDDDAHLRPDLRSLDDLARIWTKLGTTQQYYPLTFTVFWAQNRLWGDSTLGYHLVNIFLHAFSALLVLRILRRLEVPGAYLAAAIFVLHPVHVESVAWMTELKNTLSGAFYLGSVLAYLSFDRTRKTESYVLAFGLFALGLTAKTAIATFGAAMLVILWWKRGRLSWKSDALPLVPFLVVGLSAGLFTAWVDRRLFGAEGDVFDFSLIERFLIAGRSIWFHLGKLFWPAELMFMYPRWQISQTVWWQYLYPAVVALLLTVLWAMRRWVRGPLAGFLFFAGTLFPALGFFNAYSFRYSFVNDHHQYLASLGIITVASAGAALILRRGRLWQRIIGRGLGLALLVTLACLTWGQSGMYADIETLWRATIAKNPECFMAHNNLGAFLLQRGRTDEAIAHFQKVLEIQPENPNVHNNLGFALLQKGRLEEAIAHCQKAVAIEPDNPDAHLTLGGALLQRGRADEAMAHYQEGLRIRPDNVDGHNILGGLLLQKGRVREAITHFQRALELRPNHQLAENNLAWVLATSPEPSLRNGSKAMALAQQAVQLSGGRNPAIIGTLAAAYAEAGRFAEALANAQYAMQLATAQNNRALANTLWAQMECYQTGAPFRDTSQTNATARP